MKKNNLLASLCLISLAFLNNSLNAQDLTSIKVGTTLPLFTYEASSKILNVQMTIRNIGFSNSEEFDVSLVIKNTITNTEYEIDRVIQSGLSYTQLNNGNTSYIKDWKVDLKDKTQVPSGTYRVIAKINDEKKAFETNYANNNENFGSSSFTYNTSSVGVVESSNKQNIQVYPNPSNGKFNVELGNIERNTQPITVTINNILGEVINTYSVQNGLSNLEINLSNQANGFYFITIKNGSNLYTRKIKIQN
jgi:hypothetical protein